MSETPPAAMLTTRQLGSTQGTTEPYYLLDGLSERREIHLFAPENPDINHITYHRLPTNDYVPNLIWCNLALLPILFYYWKKSEVGILYTYGVFTLPPLAYASLCDAVWIVDFRTHPTGQRREFRQIRDEYSTLSKFYLNAVDYVYRLFLPHADAVMAVSPPVATDLAENYNVRKGNIQILPLGVDTEKFDPGLFKKGKTGQTRLVYLGSIREHRGIDNVIKAFSQVRNHRPNATLHIVGSGPDREVRALRRLAETESISEAIIWHGHCPHEQVPEVLATMDIALSPLPAHESFKVSSPAKIYEYLAMELPVVCSDIPAHTTVLDNGKTGFFYSAEQPNEIANVIERAIETVEQSRQTIETSTRQLAIENDWKKRVACVEAIIDEVN